MPDETVAAAEAGLVVAIVVTHRRPAQLLTALEAVLAQSRPPDLVVVVDNADDPATAQLLADLGEDRLHLVSSRRNLGGAGGFALAALIALSRGADWVWFADDDGRPADDQCLARLLRTARSTGWELVSPLVVDDQRPDQLAFPLRTGLRWIRSLSDLPAELIPGRANLFNGTLVAAGALMTVGMPDVRLFVRGDEVDVHRRLVRSTLPFGTDARARYLHPGGQDEWRDLGGGRLRVLVPEPGPKQERTFRNLGYLTSLPGLRWRAPADILRYGWYFLDRRDLPGWRRWWALWRQGRSERFP